MHKNQKGFAAIEVVLGVLLLLAIGTAVVVAYMGNQGGLTQKKTIPTPTPDSYAGWKSVSFSNGTSLRYPPGWRFTSQNVDATGQFGYFSAPAVAGNDYRLSISYGVGNITHDGQTVLASIALGAKAKKPLYTVTLEGFGTTDVSAICVADSNYAVGSTLPRPREINGGFDYSSPHAPIFTALNGKDYLLCATLAKTSDTNIPPYPQELYTSNPSYQDVVAIFKSLKD